MLNKHYTLDEMQCNREIKTNESINKKIPETKNKMLEIIKIKRKYKTQEK